MYLPHHKTSTIYLPYQTVSVCCLAMIFPFHFNLICSSTCKDCVHTVNVAVRPFKMEVVTHYNENLL